MLCHILDVQSNGALTLIYYAMDRYAIETFVVQADFCVKTRVFFNFVDHTLPIILLSYLRKALQHPGVLYDLQEGYLLAMIS